MDKSVDFSVILGQKKLGELFENAIDDALSNEVFEVNSMALKMSRTGSADIIPKGKSLLVVLPYHIDIYRSAGLFSIEASAAIHLELKVDYDVTKDLKLSTDTTLERYGWIEKPKVEIGLINIPMETVLDLLIKHYESVITAKIDESIKRQANLPQIVERGMETLNIKLSKLDTRGIHKTVQVEKIKLVPPQLDESDDISVVGRVYPVVSLSDESSDYEYENLTLEWVNELDNIDNELELSAVISYRYIADQIRKQSQGMQVGGSRLEIENVFIHNNKGMLRVEATITEPIRAQAFVTAIPFYDTTTGMLSLDEVDVKVNPSNIIYKLTTPLVNNFIENKIDSVFPMLVNEVLKKKLVDKIPAEIEIPDGKAVIMQEGIYLNELIFRDADIFLEVGVKNLDFIASIA